MKRKTEAGIGSRETCINLENLHMVYGIWCMVYGICYIVYSSCYMAVDNKLSIASFSIDLAIFCHRFGHNRQPNLSPFLPCPIETCNCMSMHLSLVTCGKHSTVRRLTQLSPSLFLTVSLCLCLSLFTILHALHANYKCRRRHLRN